MSYQPKVYRKNGGDTQVIAAGGELIMEPGSLVQWSNPTGAADYYVDLNVSATGDGSMSSPFATIAEAITASNTSIALTANRWWARRNRIFVMGDGIAEDLTILPEKCDVIGVGSDLYPFPRVTGVHVIAATRPTAGSASACRFINMGFQATGTAEVFKVPASCHGLQFIDCVFTASAAGNTKALAITDCAHVKIQGCKIITPSGAISTSIFATGISIEGTTATHDLNILDNFIFATEGIKVANGTLQGSLIARNIIRVVAGLAINDDSDDVACVDNRFISSNAAQVQAGFCDWNALLAVNNIGTSDVAVNAPIGAVVAITS